MAKYYLTGKHGENRVRYELRQGVQLVGRVAGCDLRLPDAAVSRRHAELVLEDDAIKVHDLKSLNGTFVNEAQVETEADVKPGDKVRFGHLTLTLVHHEVTPFFPEHQGSAQQTMTTTFEKVREEQRSNRLMTALAETGQQLSTTMTVELLHTRVLDLIERFIPSSRILILESFQEGKEPEVLASRISDGDPNEGLKLSRTMMKEILQEGQSFLTRDERDATQSMIVSGVHAAMGAPLFDNQNILGAIYVDSRSMGVSYREEDLQLLTVLANMIAVKLTNVRLEEEERKYTELRRELEAASQFQMNLLPKTLPEVDGYQIFAHLDPCEQVGGDLYSVQSLDDGRVWLTLGDVTGHGMGAAILMSHVMAGIRFLEQSTENPAEMVATLEHHLGDHFALGQYVTLFAGILDPKSGEMSFVNAGHTPPILVGKGREPEFLESTGMPVAIFPGAQERTIGKCNLSPGTSLLIFSDGICEATSNDIQYDEGPFQKFLEGVNHDDAPTTAHDFAAALLDDLTRHVGDVPLDDDLTLLVLQRESAGN